jgi:hypothetical protein
MANISAYEKLRQSIQGFGGKVKTAAKNIGSKVLNQIEKAIQVQRNFYAPKTGEERRFREQNLQRLKETIKKWKAEHPGFKVPKEFQDLE